MPAYMRKDFDAENDSLLDVPMSIAQERMKNGEQFTDEDMRRLTEQVEKDRAVTAKWRSDIRSQVAQFAPWFDFSPYAYARLCGALSKAYPGEPLASWMKIPVPELIGYIHAAAGDSSTESQAVDHVTLPPKKRGIKRGQKPNIPNDKRTKAMSKLEALKYIGWPKYCESERQARYWFNKSIEDGEYRCEPTSSRRLFVFHIDDFPEKARQEIKKT